MLDFASHRNNAPIPDHPWMEDPWAIWIYRNWMAVLLGTVVFLEVVYLAGEALLHHEILVVLFEEWPEPDEVEALEVRGRALASIGLVVTLSPLAFRLLRWWHGRGHVRPPLAALLVAILIAIGSSFYHFQEWAVDRLASETDEMEQFRATFAGALRREAEAGVLPLRGFVDASGEDASSAARYGAVLGTAGWTLGWIQGPADEPAELREHAINAFRRYAIPQMEEPLYEAFQEVREEYEQAWDHYQGFPEDVAGTKDHYRADLQGHYNEVRDAIEGQWSTYRSINHDYQHKREYRIVTGTGVNYIQRLVRRIRDTRADEEAHQDALARYSEVMEDKFHTSGISWQSWCDGSGCPAADHRIRRMADERFRAAWDRLSPVPPGLDKQEFLHHPDVWRRAVAEFAAESQRQVSEIDPEKLPRRQVESAADFRPLMERGIELAAWDAYSEKMNHPMKPGMSEAEFRRVVETARFDAGDLAVDGRSGFEDRILEKALESRVDHFLRDFPAKPEEVRNGKDAVQAAVVPAFVLVLSLGVFIANMARPIRLGIAWVADRKGIPSHVTATLAPASLPAGLVLLGGVIPTPGDAPWLLLSGEPLATWFLHGITLIGGGLYLVGGLV